MGFGAIIFKQPCFENGDQTHFLKFWTLVFSVLKRVTKWALFWALVFFFFFGPSSWDPKNRHMNFFNF